MLCVLSCSRHHFKNGCNFLDPVLHFNHVLFVILFVLLLKGILLGLLHLLVLFKHHLEFLEVDLKDIVEYASLGRHSELRALGLVLRIIQEETDSLEVEFLADPQELVNLFFLRLWSIELDDELILVIVSEQLVSTHKLLQLFSSKGRTST